MEVKIKLEELLSVYNTLKAIIDDKQSNIDSLLKFKLLGIMKKCQTHVANFDFVRNEKVVQYGQKTKKGTYQITKENKVALGKYNHDINKLLKSEVQINIEKLKVDQIFNKGIKAEYLIGLYPIIEQ